MSAERWNGLEDAKEARAFFACSIQLEQSKADFSWSNYTFTSTFTTVQVRLLPVCMCRSQSKIRVCAEAAPRHRTSLGDGATVRRGTLDLDESRMSEAAPRKQEADYTAQCDEVRAALRPSFRHRLTTTVCPLTLTTRRAGHPSSAAISKGAPPLLYRRASATEHS